MVTISNTILTAEIDEKGAQLSGLAKSTKEYIWDANPDIWPKHAPVLFPFVGRLKDQKFLYKGKEYGPVQIHGFAPYAMYTPYDQTDSSVRMKLIADDEIKSIWPFDFSFAVLFELVENTLKITYEVSNLGKETMYYAMGSHPGFNVPLKKGLKFEDYYLEFPDAGNVLRNETESTVIQKVYSEMNGKRLNLRHNLFDNDAAVLSNTGYKAIIGTDKDPERIVVEYPDTKYCAVWHKVKMEVPFVCIEPWTSLPGWTDRITDIEQRSDYNTLASGKSRTHHLSITIID